MANLEQLRQEGCDPSQHLWTRRNLLGLAGWGAVLSSLGAGLLAFGRFMYPRVLFEPRTEVKIGKPSEYQPNSVSERWIQSNRFWIVRNGDNIVALSGKCTHLGCTPKYLSSENKFKCPCHGSGFRALGGTGLGVAGMNFEGPAPRPLERFKIGLAEDGQLVVDTGKLYRYEKNEWGNAEAFLRFIG